MRREGHHKKPAFFKKANDGRPVWHDAYQYAILAEEWLSLSNRTKILGISL
jgi:RimJ/RimL family protein N-acetyltransferase